MRNIEIYYPFNAEGRKVSIAARSHADHHDANSSSEMFFNFFPSSSKSAIKFKVEEINVNHAILLLEVSSNRSTYVTG